MAAREPDEIAKFYASTSGAKTAPRTMENSSQGPVETTPDGDRDIDHQGILAHATKVVAAKAERDRRRFQQLYEQAISLVPTVAVLVGTMLVVSVVAYFVIAVLLSIFRVK
jgi:hypothetical protein